MRFDLDEVYSTRSPPIMIAIIESPFSGDEILNIQYARRALKDSIDRGEVPFASHLLYPQALNDKLPPERSLGMNLAKELLTVISRGCTNSHHKVVCAVYDDLGVSAGMKQGIEWASALGVPVEFRKIEGWEDRNGPSH